MRRSITAFTLAALLIFSGCSSLTPKRGVVGNTFYSTMPKLIIKFNQDFIYLENLSDSNFVEGQYGTTGRRVSLSKSKDAYIFIANEGRTVKKAVSLNIQYLDGIWRTQLSKKQKENSLLWGYEDIRDEKFTYTIWPVKPSPQAWLAKRILDMGYTMPCGLVKYSYGTVGTDRCLVTVIYFENIISNGYSCNSFNNKGILTTAQKDFLSGFNKRAMSCFELLEYKDEIVESYASSIHQQPNSKKLPKRFIEIQEEDLVYEYGKPKYKVFPGDKLQVVLSKTCRGGKGLCWKVKNTETGEIGYVVANPMKERHRVYTQE
jgi:hypothetical protein